MVQIACVFQVAKLKPKDCSPSKNFHVFSYCIIVDLFFKCFFLFCQQFFRATSFMITKFHETKTCRHLETSYALHKITEFFADFKLQKHKPNKITVIIVE